MNNEISFPCHLTIYHLFEWCAPKQSEHSSLFCFIDSCMSITLLTLTLLPFKFTRVNPQMFTVFLRFPWKRTQAVLVMQIYSCLWPPRCLFSTGPCEHSSVSAHTRLVFILLASSASWGACFCLDSPIEWYFNFRLFTSIVATVLRIECSWLEWNYAFSSLLRWPRCGPLRITGAGRMLEQDAVGF